MSGTCYLIMDSAYEGDETRRLASQLGYIPVVPPNPRRQDFLGNMIASFTGAEMKLSDSFRRLKAYRRVFCRFDKLDALFSGFVVLALIIEALRISVNRP